MIDFLLSTYDVIFSEYVKYGAEYIIRCMKYTIKNIKMLLNTDNSVIYFFRWLHPSFIDLILLLKAVSRYLTIWPTTAVLFAKILVSTDENYINIFKMQYN